MHIQLNWILQSGSTSAFVSGVDVQEAEDCTTEATTPTSCAPVSQSQMSTLELDESAPEDAPSSQTSTSPVSEGNSPAEEGSPPGSSTQAESVLAPPEDERDSEKKEEPEGDSDSSSQSVDELLADWREDLEAFKQMEKDELWQLFDILCPLTLIWCRHGQKYGEELFLQVPKSLKLSIFLKNNNN